MYQEITGALFKQMILHGAAAITAQKQAINDLNGQSLLVVYYKAAEKPFFKTRRVRGEYFSHARAL